jgi:hypothetical protein
MLDQFFPNLSLEKTEFLFSDIRLIVAALLRNEDVRKVKKILVETCKWPHEKVKAVCFLIESLSFTGVNVARLLKSYESTFLTTDLVKEFSSRFLDQNRVQILTKATLYTETISGDDLLAQGFSGKSLGDKKVELEDAEFAKFCAI